jgi:hypothetical protein
MAPEDMLSVTPEAMVKAIVQRRERMAKELPIELEKRREENDRAYVLTNRPRAPRRGRPMRKTKPFDDEPSLAYGPPNMC